MYGQPLYNIQSILANMVVFGVVSLEISTYSCLCVPVVSEQINSLTHWNEVPFEANGSVTSFEVHVIRVTITWISLQTFQQLYKHSQPILTKLSKCIDVLVTLIINNQYCFFSFFRGPTYNIPTMHGWGSGGSDRHLGPSWGDLCVISPLPLPGSWRVSIGSCEPRLCTWTGSPVFHPTRTKEDPG